MSTPDSYRVMNAGESTSPFFPIAATIMAVLNLAMGALSGLFNSPLSSSGIEKAGYILGYAVGSALLIPLLIVLAIRLFGHARQRRGAIKAFFFISVLLLPVLVVSLTAGVVQRMDKLRTQKAEESTWYPAFEDCSSRDCSSRDCNDRYPKSMKTLSLS